MVPDNASQKRSQVDLSGVMLVMLAGLAALGALATNIVLPAFPHIAEDLDTTPRQLSIILSSFFIVFAVGQLFVGPLSDRYGRKRLVAGGIVVFVAGSVICAVAGNLSVLVVGRVLQAAGACAASVLSRAIARDLFDGEALARALGLTMVAMAAAPGFSPLVGSAIDGLFGWRVTFAAVALFASVLGAYYWRRIGETHAVDKRAPATVRATVSAYANLVYDPLFIWPAMAVSLVVGGLYTLFATAPAILMGDLGLSSLQLGLFFAATVIVVFAAGLLAPRLSQRCGPTRIALLGILSAMLGGFVLVGLMFATSFVVYVAGVSAFLFGMGLVNPLCSAMALRPFGTQAGLASALLGFLQMSCAAIGASLAGALPLSLSTSLAVLLSGAATLSLLVFIPAARRKFH